MGLSGVSLGELLIVLVIVLLIFGSGRLARAGSDLGSAMRGFRKAMSEDGPRTDNSGAPGYPDGVPANNAAAPGGALSHPPAPVPHPDTVSRA